MEFYPYKAEPTWNTHTHQRLSQLNIFPHPIRSQEHIDDYIKYILLSNPLTTVAVENPGPESLLERQTIASHTRPDRNAEKPRNPNTCTETHFAKHENPQVASRGATVYETFINTLELLIDLGLP